MKPVYESCNLVIVITTALAYLGQLTTDRYKRASWLRITFSSCTRLVASPWTHVTRSWLTDQHVAR